MGIQSRDYYRSETAGPSWLGDCPMVRWLIVVNSVVFVLQLLFVQPSQDAEFGGFLSTSLIDEWFALDPELVARGQVWRVVTYAFLHDRYSLWHILLNMLTLWWAGRSVEPIYGSREFLWFYLVAAAIGGVGFTLWGWALALPNGVVGASGAVMAVLMLFARHYPRSKIYFFGLIGIEAQWLVAIYALLDLHPVLLALGGAMPFDRVAHVVHLAGYAFGWLYYQQSWRLATGWNQLTDRLSLRWRRATHGRNLKVYRPELEREPEPVDLDAEVDRILAKITATGSESLSDRERALLTRASERYKKRD
jgi:membrane associated rhomboid family serine protease